MAENPYIKKLKDSLAQPRDQNADAYEVIREDRDRWKTQCEQHMATILRLTEDKVTLAEFAAESKGRAAAAEARADAAERALASETRRADECDRMHKACMADCEQLRTKLISEVESRSKAEGALAGMREAAGRPAPPLVTPSKGKVRYEVRRSQTGEIVSIDATPEG